MLIEFIFHLCINVCTKGYPKTFQKELQWPIISEGHRSPEIKGQVNFQVAQIELKFGEGDARPRASVQNVY